MITYLKTHAAIVNYVDDLRQYVYSHLSCEEDARDIAQEPCLRTLQFPVEWHMLESGSGGSFQ